MLILTRCISEAIIIGEDDSKAIIRVIGVNGSQAKLGIDAAKSIPVHREEIWERIQADRKPQDKLIMLGVNALESTEHFNEIEMKKGKEEL